MGAPQGLHGSRLLADGDRRIGEPLAAAVPQSGSALDDRQHSRPKRPEPAAVAARNHRDGAARRQPAQRRDPALAAQPRRPDRHRRFRHRLLLDELPAELRDRQAQDRPPFRPGPRNGHQQRRGDHPGDHQPVDQYRRRHDRRGRRNRGAAEFRAAARLYRGAGLSVQPAAHRRGRPRLCDAQFRGRAPARAAGGGRGGGPMSAFKQRLATAGAWYLRRLEYFIPPDMRADREASNQAKMFLISHSMGPILGNAVPLAVLLFNPTPRLDAVILAVAITMFWVFPFLLRRGVKYELLVLTSVVNLNFCILWSCYFYGGVSSPTLPWLLTIPILSLFYIGGEKRLQPHLLAISAGSFAIFITAYNLLPPPAIDMPPTAIHGLGIVSTTAALCYVATMAIYYARIFDAGVELEKEV